MISVCYVLSYYSPNYIRTRTLISALQKISFLKLYQARNTTKQPFRYIETLLKLIIIRLLKNPQYYVLGFRGYEIYWIVRMITLGKPLIFDHMMSPYDSLVNESKTINDRSFVERFIYFYERSILYSSQIILTDTELHKMYFQQLFNLDPEKILVIPVGTDEDIFKPIKQTSNSLPFEVLFYGSFLPLHGIDIILKAASLLRNYPIHFTFIGGNKAKIQDFHKIVDHLSLDKVTYLRWVEFENLPGLIARTDLGLGGPFGNTNQAQRVITGKTFQFLAMAKPVIVGKIDLDYGFEDKKNCLLVQQGDEKALAKAIYWAFTHVSELKSIGSGGYELYRLQYSIYTISKKLRKCFDL